MCKRFTVSLFTVLVMSLIAQAATLTIVDLPATGTDAAIGIDIAKTYTHAFDFGTSGVVTINGVALEQGPTAALSAAYTATSAQGYGYTITDTRAAVSIAMCVSSFYAVAGALRRKILRTSGGAAMNSTIRD